MIRKDKALIQDLHSQTTVEELVKIIKELDFTGVSGRIKFENGNSRLSEIKIQQFELKKQVWVGQSVVVPSELLIKEIGRDANWMIRRVKMSNHSFSVDGESNDDNLDN